jgi:hypothetical protein
MQKETSEYFNTNLDSKSRKGPDEKDENSFSRIPLLTPGQS